MAPEAAEQRLRRRLANDAAIRAAALEECHRRGIDALGPTAVARAAGLTTGAVYARHEDVTELVVDLWQSTLAPQVRDFVALAAATASRDPVVNASANDRIFALHLDPPPALVVGLEAVLVARRNTAIGEVVLPDVAAELAAVGLGAASGDPDQHAMTAMLLAIHLGLALMGPWGPAGDPTEEPIDWRGAFGFFTASSERPLPDPPDVDPDVDEIGGRFPGPDELDGDPTRSRLLHAAMEVMARTGVERATVSRIARRAGVSHGAIYAAFATKDELVAATVRTVSDRLGAQDAERGAEVAARNGNFGAVATVFLSRLSTERRQWQRFRLECLVAARWSPEVAGALDDLLSRLLDEGAVAIGAIFGSALPLARAQRRAIFAASLGYTWLAIVDGAALDTVDWRRSAGRMGAP